MEPFLKAIPFQPTPFVGRAEELAEITALLADPACRLLTIIGPGGVGKTRLALETAQRLPFPGNIHFVALQPLTSTDFIVPAIAEAIHFQFYSGGEPKQQLLDYLGEKSLLLVMDNFEHLLDGAELVSEILAYVPAVKMLATSRERLNLVEEWVFSVDGLLMPASEAEMEIGDYDAVQLFLQSAQRVQVGFKLTDAQKPAVTRICRLVGGMPLGIELAAAWVRALSCEEIADEIARSLDILATPARNVAPRHRTMRAVLEHSWNLLTDEERVVFRKLSVFLGGFRKEAAQAVAGASLQILSALVDKSLLRVDASGRYDVHELLRQYSEEQLVLSGDMDKVCDAHSAYFADFMCRRESDLKGRRQKDACREIEVEIDNVRTAWQWSVMQGAFEDVEKHSWSLLLFYWVQGRLQEGEATFEQAVSVIERDDEEKNYVLGQLYARQAFCSVQRGLYTKGRELLFKCLAILRPLDARWEIGFALAELGCIQIYLGSYAEADEILQEGAAIFRELGDDFGIAWVLGNRSYLSYLLERYDEAKQWAQEAIMISRSHGDSRSVGLLLIVPGQIEQRLGNYEEAKRRYQESLELATEIPSPPLIGLSLFYLGWVSHALQEDNEASLYYYRALETAKDLGMFRLQLDVLAGVTELLLEQGNREHAVELLALVAHHPASQIETRDRARQLLQEIAAQFPPEVFASCQEKGRALRLDDAIKLLYETRLLARWRAAVSGLNERAALRTDSYLQSDFLTKRELEILHLMAQGMSNREIADTLVLALGTVKWYISEIYSKLDVKSRAQAVARARELKLLS